MLPCDGMAGMYPAESCKDPAFDLTEEVVRKFGSVRLRLMGTSMVPSILPGDLVTIRHAGLNEIYPGEVILFSREGGFAAHRVVTRRGTSAEPYLITRGDRLLHDDSPVFSSALLGRVESIERNGYRVQTAGRLSIWQRCVARLLRFSDTATYFYLRLVSVCGRLSYGDRNASRENCHIS